jgi:hypothetical protein
MQCFSRFPLFVESSQALGVVNFVKVNRSMQTAGLLHASFDDAHGSFYLFLFVAICC